MGKNDDLETARNILKNAVEMNIGKEIILKISQKIDKYVLDYYVINRNVDKREEDMDSV
ncbi:MAG: Spo0E family sporulation regulatory protein-aspartic acid phosphatase [Syntrophomonadaceae bacterium]|nr:Spo0E family sporulation regulatory protein-aspartic acid phosphatase [Syntrophomonadaceae bacterium]